MVAAENGHEKCLQMLIKAGGEVNSFENNIKALRATIDGGYEKCFELLINAGVDVNLGSENCNTVLMKAVGAGAIKAYWSRHHANIKFVKLLIAAGADVNAQRRGFTALMHAAFQGHSEVVKMLIDSGADVNILDCDGHTAMLHAAREYDFKSVTYMVEAGADVNVCDENGNTAMIYAAHGHWYDVVNMLIAAGADVNIQNNDHETVLSIVGGYFSYLNETYPGQFGCVEILIKAGADVKTALKGMRHYTHKNPKSIRMFLAVGATVNLWNENDQQVIWNSEYLPDELLEQLYVSGGNIGDETETVRESLIEMESEKDLHLSHLCRDVIREHLQELDQRENLFIRVPRLGLPKPLQSYLLYDMSLDKIREEFVKEEDN